MDEDEGFLEDLLGVVDYTARGAFVKVVAGAGGLAEEADELVGFGFELRAVLFEGVGFVRGFDDLIS